MIYTTRCITESARPRRATSTILRIVCGNFLKPVGGKGWKSSFIGLEFSTSILIGCNYVNNAAALTRCLILWKSLCACRLPYPKAIKNNFSSLPIYMFRGLNHTPMNVTIHIMFVLLFCFVNLYFVQFIEKGKVKEYFIEV